MIDAIIERKNMREELGKLLRLHSQKAAETFASKSKHIPDRSYRRKAL